ncbi:hypothetical protein ISS07_01960 [Candidatus Woesearchaeota archaeon]|nr:hypothetical protein [Candidatus Woesearchaeota archaeon]
MATFLDVTALQNFSVIFVFLFVWLLVYAMLTYTKTLGGNNIIYALIGVVIAFFVVMSNIATLVVKQVAPILAVILVFAAIISIASNSLGTGSWGLDNPSLKYIIVVVLVVALIVGTLTTLRANVEVPETGEDYSKTSTIIFHPNFLGMILIFLVAVFTVGLLASKQM